MRPVRLTNEKLVVNIDALVEFFRHFHAPSMIPAIVELVEFATTHPEYDKRFPDEQTWLDADIATDVLAELFSGDWGAPTDIDELSSVTVNPKRGATSIRFPTHEKPPGPPTGSSEPSAPLPRLPALGGMPGPLGIQGSPPGAPIFPPLDADVQGRARRRRLRGPRG